jgi:hypothetical protein
MLTITLAPGSPPGTVVKRDDVVLGGPSIGLPLPVDPGEHVVTATPPRGQAATEKVTLAKGETKSIVLAPKADPTAEGDAAGGPGAVAGPTNDGSTQRVAGFVVGGVGVAGVVVGAITGGLTLAKKSTITANCDLDTHQCKNTTGRDAATSAQTTGLVSTIGFIAGVAGLGGGAVLLLTAPKRNVAVGLLDAGPRGATLGARGAF